MVVEIIRKNEKKKILDAPAAELALGLTSAVSCGKESNSPVLLSGTTFALDGTIL